MTVLIILLVLIALYFLIPKGVLLYEALRWLSWVVKLKLQPNRPYREEKIFYGSHPRQYFLLVQPKEAKSQKKSAIVYIHGGGWQFGSPEMFHSNSLALMNGGYSVFMLSHRRIPRYGILDLREDLVAALQKLEETMVENNFLEKKLILGGVSSGGNLAALLAFDPKLRSKLNWEKNAPYGLFLISAPLNLRSMWYSPPLRFLVGKRDDEHFRPADPIQLIEPRQTIHTFIIHGTHDGLVRYQGVKDFYEKMKSEGAANLRFVTLENGTHLDAASWCLPDHPANLALMKWLEELDDQAKALSS